MKNRYIILVLILSVIYLIHNKKSEVKPVVAEVIKPIPKKIPPPESLPRIEPLPQIPSIKEELTILEPIIPYLPESENFTPVSESETAKETANNSVEEVIIMKGRLEDGQEFDFSINEENYYNMEYGIPATIKLESEIDLTNLIPYEEYQNAIQDYEYEE